MNVAAGHQRALFQTLLRWFETAFVAVTLLLFTQAMMHWIVPEGGKTDSVTFIRFLWPPIYLITIFLIIGVANRFFHLSLRALVLWLPVLLALASFLWAVDPGLAMRRSIALAMTTAFAFYVASRFSLRDVIAIFASVFALLAVSSLTMALLFPDLGVMQSVHIGAWKGVFLEKNPLGGFMARGVVVFLCASLFFPRLAPLWLPLAGLSFLLVVMSQSLSALMGLLAALCVMGAIFILRRGAAISMVFFYLVIVALGSATIAALGYPDEVTQLLGRDVTLTGRTDIWSATFPVIDQRPWLGFGFDQFWEVDSPDRRLIWEAANWQVTGAHNGWLDTALSLGMIGVLLVGLGLIAVVLAALTTLGHGRIAYFIWPIIILQIVYTLSESTLLIRNGTLWVMFLIVAAKVFVGERDGEPTRFGRVVAGAPDALAWRVPPDHGEVLRCFLASQGRKGRK
jgi:exopolysaccharide production protein ExoQ